MRRLLCMGLGVRARLHVGDELVDPAGEDVKHHFQQPLYEHDRLQAGTQPLSHKLSQSWSPRKLDPL